MSTYGLERILAPRSVALVGASPRESSVGRKILHNLREAGFAGPLHLVNPRHAEVDGLVAVRKHRPVGARARPRRHRGASYDNPRHRRGRRYQRMRRRRHHHGGAWAWTGLARGRGRTDGARTRAAADRSELPRRDGAGRPAERELCGARATCRRSRAGFAVGRDRGRHGRMGGDSARSAFRRSCRSATRSTSISPIASTISRSTVRRAPSCSMSSRSTTRASSCRPRALRRAPSPSWWSSPAATRKVRAPPRPIPARSRARMRFTTRRSGAPACCACAGWTNCSRPPKCSGGSSRSTASALPFLPMGAASACSRSTA